MNTRSQQQGFVLVVVMWVLAILTIITLGLVNRIMLDHRMAYYALDQDRAMMMARGAVQRGIVEVRNKAFKDWLKKDEFGGMTYLGQPWARPKNMLDGEIYNAEGMDRDICRYVIEDAERFININTCNRKVLESIDVLSAGAERAIKARRSDPVHEQEGISQFQAIEELRYLRDVKDDDWFGEDDEPGLKDILTVYGGRVNFNTASREVLQNIPELSDNAIDALLGYRIGGDGELGTADDQGFRDYADVTEKTGITGDDLQALRDHCSYRSSYYIVTGIATLQGGKVRAKCSAVVYVEGNEATEVAWKEVPIGA